MSADEATASGKPATILVRGVNWLGDAIMTIPALDSLREARPADSITILSHSKLADLWKGHSAVDRVITFDRSDDLWALARRLRRESFDLALLLPNSIRSALECFLAGIPVRVGYARNGRGLLLTRRVTPRSATERMRKRSVAEIRRLIRKPETSHKRLPTSFEAHQIHDYLHLVQALGARSDPRGPRVSVQPEEVQAFAQKFELEQIRKRGIPIFGMNAGAEYGPAKRWPIERFIEVGVEVQRLTGCCWLIFGGATDEPLAAALTHGILTARASIAKASDAPLIRNLCGKTTLRELCSGLSLCSVVLTNDTGPMHLAAAVGARVVVPFGSTSPDFTAPGLPGDLRHTILQAGVPCAPCFRRACPIDLRCLTQIAPEAVAKAVVVAASASGVKC